MLRLEEHVPLAPLTSLRLGGAARYLARCDSTDAMRQALRWAGARHLPVHVLGGGTNTVFADAGYGGLVIKVEGAGVQLAEDGDGVVVAAAAGADWDGLVSACVDAGLSGVECLSGIPGLVGATPMQNVGAYGQEVADAIVAVRALDRTGLEEVTFARAECGFGYRTSRFKTADRDRYLVTRVDYRLSRARRPEVRYAELARRLERDGVDLAALPPGREALRALRAAVLALRRGKSMVLDDADPNARSAGSFFLNPTLGDDALAALKARWQARGGDPATVPVYAAGAGAHKVAAAWLVERAGFAKGTVRGGAAVSEKHALALVNRGGTTADLLALATAVADAVHAAFGVRLEREPVCVPSAGGPAAGGG